MKGLKRGDQKIEMYKKTSCNHWIIAVYFISAMAFGTELTSGLMAKIEKSLKEKEIQRKEPYTLYFYEEYRPKEEDGIKEESIQGNVRPVVYPSGIFQSRRFSHPVIENILGWELASGDYKFNGIVIRNIGYSRQKIYEVTKGNEKIYLSDSHPYSIGTLLGTTNVKMAGFICGKQIHVLEPVLQLGEEYDDFCCHVRMKTTFCSGYTVF